MEYVVSSSDIVRSNPVFIRLAIHYQRGAKERQYLRDLLTPLIKQVVEDPSIDLETDPLLVISSTLITISILARVYVS